MRESRLPKFHTTSYRGTCTSELKTAYDGSPVELVCVDVGVVGVWEAVGEEPVAAEAGGNCIKIGLPGKLILG